MSDGKPHDCSAAVSARREAWGEYYKATTSNTVSSSKLQLQHASSFQRAKPWMAVQSPFPFYFLRQNGLLRNWIPDSVKFYWRKNAIVMDPMDCYLSIKHFNSDCQHIFRKMMERLSSLLVLHNCWENSCSDRLSCFLGFGQTISGWSECTPGNLLYHRDNCKWKVVSKEISKKTSVTKNCGFIDHLTQ